MDSESHLVAVMVTGRANIVVTFHKSQMENFLICDKLKSIISSGKKLQEKVLQSHDQKYIPPVSCPNGTMIFDCNI